MSNTNNAKLRNCCVGVMQQLHDVAATAWWGEYLFMASPCLLVLPKLNPFSNAGQLLNTAMIEVSKISITELKKRIANNQHSSDFRNAVNDLWRWKFWPMHQIAVGHANKHLGKPAYTSYWHTIGEAYRQALVS